MRTTVYIKRRTGPKPSEYVMEDCVVWAGEVPPQLTKGRTALDMGDVNKRPVTINPVPKRARRRSRHRGRSNNATSFTQAFAQARGRGAAGQTSRVAVRP